MIRSRAYRRRPAVTDRQWIGAAISLLALFLQFVTPLVAIALPAPAHGAVSGSFDAAMLYRCAPWTGEGVAAAETEGGKQADTGDGDIAGAMLLHCLACPLGGVTPGILPERWLDSGPVLLSLAPGLLPARDGPVIHPLDYSAGPPRAPPSV